MDQENGWRESSLRLPRVLWLAETQRYRCKERQRDREKRQLRESRSPVLLALCLFDFTLKVRRPGKGHKQPRSEEHTSELQSLAYLVCRLLLEKKNKHYNRCHIHI